MKGSCAASAAIDPTLVARFAASVARLLAADARLGLAVSGGPDSMAMLALAHAAMPGRIAVATVNHGLRPEAAAECALVAKACAARDVPCAVLPVAVAGGNLQHQARRARYRALGQWADAQGLAAIATAHHADDQAETLLLRLNRGSGVAGLAGVREQRALEGARAVLIRPLLAWRRAELARVVDQASMAVACDPSNADVRFDRVRMRQQLEACGWLDPLALAQSAAHLAEAGEALQAWARLLWPKQVREEGSSLWLAPGPLREINRRLLAMAIERLGGRPRGRDVARLLARLEAGEGGNVAGVLATSGSRGWHLRPEPPRRTGQE